MDPLKVWAYVCLVIEGIQLLLATFTIIYLVKKKHLRNLSWFIIIQIGLLWMLSFLFSVRNVWMVVESTYSLGRGDVPYWVFYSDMFANNTLWLQHWMYVSLYTRVSLIVPLIFCYQTEQVK